MTGHELLAELTKLSESELNLEVRTEGCDCYGDVAKVAVEPIEPDELEIVLHRGKP